LAGTWLLAEAGRPASTKNGLLRKRIGKPSPLASFESFVVLLLEEKFYKPVVRRGTTKKLVKMF
jgi:hypothetical protein